MIEDAGLRDADGLVQTLFTFKYRRFGLLESGFDLGLGGRVFLGSLGSLPRPLDRRFNVRHNNFPPC